ncbi:polysaccharide biosynthesis tyrosine autokinase [Acetobacterium bakii]|uniref:Uncharacterized protein n=1 Tax=Acetobacterium bakii TaxID=52689 RepID=A0A0L6U0J8_9FIRM|nr:polysaccharide biosynthesis tyrosine autokinase [Acetobacterium bakii]KNZ42028.1 hypothetical protein AKG39_08810 [Acetobacterium bakii]
MMNANNGFIEHRSRTGKEEIGIGDIVHAIAKKWWLVLVFGLLMGAAAYFITRITYVPLYTANASMALNTERSYDVSMVDTYSPILISDNVLEKVVAETKRTVDLEILRDYIVITSPKNSGIINIAVSDLNPQIAMDTANAIVKIAPGVIAETMNRGTFNTLDFAKMPVVPDPPEYLKNTAIGAILGIMMGVLIVIGLRILFPKIRGAKEINENLRLSVLGEIPRNRDLEDRMKTQLITDPEVGVPYVEAFKRLGIHVKNMKVKTNFKTFLLTSAMEDDGKTTVSVNLSLVLASAGATVLFMEGDTPKSKVFKRLAIKQTFTDLKKDGIVQKDLIAKIPGMDLYVMPLKPEENRSGITINENDISEMMPLLENEFDYVVIDSPPAFILSDAAMWSKYVDGVMLVVRQEESGLDMLIKTTNILEGVGANIVGCILSDTKNYQSSKKSNIFKRFSSRKIKDNPREVIKKEA